MKRILYITLLAAASLAYSCGDFLKEYSQDLSYARDCNDLDEVLVGNVYFTRQYNSIDINNAGVEEGLYYYYLQLMDDDIKEWWGSDAKSGVVSNHRRIHQWHQNPYTNTVGSELNNADWGRLYKHIAHCNVLFSLVDTFTDDPEEQRARIKGECHFIRAASYFMLVNIFALPYDRNTAATDLGVTIKLTEFVDHEPFARNTTAEVYDLIIADLNASISYLKDIDQRSVYRASEKAAHMFLSRVYLYMGEWELALAECNAVMKMGINLWDLNDFKPNSDFIVSGASPETIFTMGTNTSGTLSQVVSDASGTYGASDELRAAYDETNDRRFACYYNANATRAYPRKMPSNSRTAFDAFLLRASEVYLNKAEAEAMTDNAEAKNTLNTFLATRYTPGNAPDISALTGEALVKFIRDERRRELSFENHRWLDLRRYAVSPKYQERVSITHRVTGDRNATVGSYTLKPYGEDRAWVLPIPKSEIDINDGMLVQNPEREAREMD